MSGKVMGMVFAADLPRVEKVVLLAIADHVVDDGRGCYASEARIVFKTGYDLSYVQKAIKRLLARGVLLVSHQHPEFGVDVWDINLDTLKPPMPFETWLRTEWPKIMNRRCGRSQNGAGAKEPSGNGRDPLAHAGAERQADAFQDDDWDASLDDVEQPWGTLLDDDEHWWNACRDHGQQQDSVPSEDAEQPWGAAEDNAVSVADCAPGGTGSPQREIGSPNSGASLAADCAPVGNGSPKRENSSPNSRAVPVVACATVVNGSHKRGNSAQKRGNNAPLNLPIEASHSNRETYSGRSAKPLTPAMDARVNPAAKTKLARERAKERAEAGEEDLQARDRPQTDLQRKVAQLCNAKYLTSATKAGLHGTVSTAWRGNSTKLPITYSSPEDEWAANPELFAEYVELCARRICEESGWSPSRAALVKSIRRYARYNTGWLDFRQAAQEERRVNPPPKERPLYWDPNKPSWMQ